MKNIRWNRWLSLLSVLCAVCLLGGCAAPAAETEASESSKEMTAGAQTETNEQTAGEQTGAEGQTAGGMETSGEQSGETTAAESEAPTEGFTGPVFNENGLVFTQTEMVGVCSDADVPWNEKYAEFAAIAEPFAITPGLMEHLVPQGMCQQEGTGNLYMGGYVNRKNYNPFNESNPSAVAMMNADGELKAEYVMYYADGRAFKSHMGGVAVSEETLFVAGLPGKDADGNETYWIAAVPLETLVTEGHQDVYLDTFYQVPVKPGYMSYTDGVLWIGNFYMKGDSSYVEPNTIGVTEADNDKGKFGTYVLGYDLTEQGAARMESEDGECAMPDEDKVYCTVERIQGMTRLADGRIVLSQSYGRGSKSNVLVFEPSMAETKAIVIDGTEFTGMMLEMKTCCTYSCSTMPMTEGVTVKVDGSGLEVLLLYESGAINFSGDGTYDRNVGKYRTDYIWKVTIPEK